jgi:hypothetical protein
MGHRAHPLGQSILGVEFSVAEYEIKIATILTPVKNL